MTVLPIMERELRVASKKPGTAWLRVLAALLAIVIGAAFISISLATGTTIASFGIGLFRTLTWLTLATVLAAGLFFTADCLSEEKREGTLGFLFLTDLGGLDVVTGKLLATSLRASYALLAVFPVLALTLLMGGVTGGQFWRSALALVNALFCSLATGLLVSSVCRDGQKALAGTFVALLLECAAGPIVDGAFAAASLSRPGLSYTSPIYAFWTASAGSRSGYWPGLITSHLVGWALLGLSGILVRKTWQDRPKTSEGVGYFNAHRFRFGRPAQRLARRLKFLEPNPVVWLVLRERWQGMIMWVLAAGMLCLFVGAILVLPSMGWMLWGQMSWLVLAGIYLLVASQSCRFLIDARRSGLLELLLVTPLNSKDLFEGQWRAIVQLFGPPISVLILLQVFGSMLSQTKVVGMMSAPGGLAAQWLVGICFGLGAGISMAANLVALAWVGMWMGLSTTKGSIATLKTLVFVQVLPWLVISVISTAVAAALMLGKMAVRPSNSLMVWFPLLMAGISTVLSLAKDAVFIGWARGQLRRNFRQEASKPARPMRMRMVSQTATVSPPPVISTQR